MLTLSINLNVLRIYDMKIKYALKPPFNAFIEGSKEENSFWVEISSNIL